MAAKKKAKRVSGPSGQHTKPGIMLRASPEEFEAWKAAAAARREPLSLTQWIRVVCNNAAEREGRRLTQAIRKAVGVKRP